MVKNSFKSTLLSLAIFYAFDVQGGEFDSNPWPLRVQRLMASGSPGSPDETIGAIKDIIQDAQGYMWFAGEFGLARYDSHNFRFYYYDSKNSASISSNYVSCLALDRMGVLWLGTIAGLNRFDPTTNKFIRYTAGDGPLGLSSNVVISLAVMPDNRLFVGTAAGLNVLNADRSEFLRPGAAGSEFKAGSESLRAGYVRSIMQDSKRRIWFGVTGVGLMVFDIASGSFLPIDQLIVEQIGLGIKDVERVFEDSNGNFWVASAKFGLLKIDAGFNSVKHYKNDPSQVRSLGGNAIRDVMEDRANRVWVATDHGGLSLYEPKSDSFTSFRHNARDPGSLRSNQLRDIFEDRDGNLWVGTVPDGVNLIDVNERRFTKHLAAATVDSSLPLDDITSLHEDSTGLVWVGSEGGLASINPISHAVVRYYANPALPSALSFNAVTAIQEDRHGDIWVGTWSGGLNKLIKNSGTFVRYPFEAGKAGSIPSPNVAQIARDWKGDIWVGFSEFGGIARYVAETDSFERFSHDPSDDNSLCFDFVKALIADRRGNLWIGTLNGLDRFNIATKTFTHFKRKEGDVNSLASDHILSLREDAAGNIWIGTKGDGVNIFNPRENTFRLLTTYDGLPSNAVTTITQDKGGDMWLGTINGVARYGADKTIQVWRKKDGMAGTNVNHNASLLASSGNLFFGSSEGLTEFNPATLDGYKSSGSYAIRFNDLKIGNVTQVPGERGSVLDVDLNSTTTLKLEPNESMVSIDYSTVSFNTGLSLFCRYRMDGFDKKWVHAPCSFQANYTNLPDGDYLFKVQALTDKGLHTEEATLHIRLKPPWFKTWWAYGFYIGLVGAGFWVRHHMMNLRVRSDAYRALSMTDPLTGILNRNGLNELVKKIFASARVRLSVMVIDVDHFKKINDQRGHDAGDRVLVELVRVIKGVIRSSDELARWGGEEFILLCPGTGLDGALLLAEKIRSSTESAIFEAGYSPLKVTVSMGVTECGLGDNFDGMLKRADTALYTAKREGRNCVRFM